MQQAAFKLSTGIAAEGLALPPESSSHWGGSAWCTPRRITCCSTPQCQERIKGDLHASVGSHPSPSWCTAYLVEIYICRANARYKVRQAAMAQRGRPVWLSGSRARLVGC